MNDLYIPEIPGYAAKAIEKEKNKGHLPPPDNFMEKNENSLMNGRDTIPEN
jgi:hypothetical protein